MSALTAALFEVTGRIFAGTGETPEFTSWPKARDNEASASYHQLTDAGRIQVTVTLTLKGKGQHAYAKVTSQFIPDQYSDAEDELITTTDCGQNLVRAAVEVMYELVTS